jgi:hypothetical protein
MKGYEVAQAPPGYAGVPCAGSVPAAGKRSAEEECGRIVFQAARRNPRHRRRTQGGLPQRMTSPSITSPLARDFSWPLGATRVLARGRPLRERQAAESLASVVYIRRSPVVGGSPPNWLRFKNPNASGGEAGGGRRRPKNDSWSTVPASTTLKPQGDGISACNPA